MYAVSEGGNVHLVPKKQAPSARYQPPEGKRRRKKKRKTPRGAVVRAGDGGGGRDKYGLAGV